MFALLSLGWCLFTVVSYKEYLPRGNNGNALYFTTNGSVSIAGWVIPVVTIPYLDFV